MSQPGLKTSRRLCLPPEHGHLTISQASQLSMCKVEVVISSPNIYLLMYSFCWFHILLPPPPLDGFNPLGL